MALQTINIDDRTYEQLLEELKKHIPVAEWTDHNPSDPGIMLLELICWAGEMSLYRMNRIPESHKDKFLKLIIDPPEPVMVEVKLRLDPPRTEDFSIQAGIRFASDFKNGKRYIFETFQESILPKPPENTENEEQKKQIGSVITRIWKEIREERLGVSKGTPNQTFPLKHGPVLIDFVYASDNYRPNPEISVGNDEWILKPFLLTEDSRVSPTNEAKHFMVDDFENIIRFGDGVFGAIPPEEKEIVCKRYQILEGPEALIKAGEIKYILDEIPGLQQSGENLYIEGSEDAEGEMNFIIKEEMFTKGLENFKKPYRLITSEDFERALLIDFNELQRLTRENEFNKLREKAPNELPSSTLKILRVIAIMNRRPLSSRELEEREGNVTILVIPEFIPAETPPYISQEMIELDPLLRNKILRFLERRRLITTRIHLVSAKLKEIKKIKIDVVIIKEKSFLEMEDKIRKEIYDFISILKGFFDKKGWPLGKNLYRSYIYRLVEDIKGVDHVRSLILEPSNDQGDVEIAEYELPVINTPEIIEINIYRK